mgnify:CR=1 FL=1
MGFFYDRFAVCLGMNWTPMQQETMRLGTSTAKLERFQQHVNKELKQERSTIEAGSTRKKTSKCASLFQPAFAGVLSKIFECLAVRNIILK